MRTFESQSHLDYFDLEMVFLVEECCQLCTDPVNKAIEPSP